VSETETKKPNSKLMKLNSGPKLVWSHGGSLHCPIANTMSEQASCACITHKSEGL